MSRRTVYRLMGGSPRVAHPRWLLDWLMWAVRMQGGPIRSAVWRWKDRLQEDAPRSHRHAGRSTQTCTISVGLETGLRCESAKTCPVELSADAPPVLRSLADAGLSMTAPSRRYP